MAALEFSGSLDDAKSQVPFDDPFCDHLPAADAQRAIFCDIGNVIFYRGKELVLAVKLPPAGRREMDAFFFQAQNQVKNLRRRALGSVL